MSEGRRVRAVRKGEPAQEETDFTEEPSQAPSEGEPAATSQAHEAREGEPQEVLSAEEAEERASNPESSHKRFEVGGENAQEAFENIKDQVQYWVARGRYSKVRIKRNGKQLGPDIPVAALLAFEAATFFGAGILRGALMHVVGRVFFEVELINEAEEHHGEGVALFLAGDLEGAQQCFEKAIAVDQRYAPAHLQMGVLYKVKNELGQAKAAFEEAQRLDPEGATGQEAMQHLEQMQEG